MSSENNSQLRWLYVDLNSYFASVEQQLRPELRDKPIAVVPMLTDTTCCLAASYEAKAFGIKTGTTLRDARKLCPNIKFIKANHERYIDFHHKILAAVDLCIPIEAVYSIDEVACRLTGTQQDEKKARLLAHKIKQSILKNAGDYLRCSIGIAPNRYLSKIAADMQKPDGLTILNKSDLPHALKQLSLRDFTGIGSNMEKRLNRAGIFSTEKLLSLDKHLMKQAWGSIYGEYFYLQLRGEDIQTPKTSRNTIGHSHVLPPELRSHESAYQVIQKLTGKAARRLRKQDLWTSHLSITVRYKDKTKWEASEKFIECQDTLTLLEVVKELWKGNENQYKIGFHELPIQVSVTLLKLIHEDERTLSFFDAPKRIALSQTLDKIYNRYGKDAVYFGASHDIRKAAPTAIAFTNIPSKDE